MKEVSFSKNCAHPTYLHKSIINGTWYTAFCIQEVRCESIPFLFRGSILKNNIVGRKGLRESVIAQASFQYHNHFVFPKLIVFDESASIFVRSDRIKFL